MKKLLKLLIPKHHPKLERCTSFEIKKEEADECYGGYREYKPPIYETENTTGKPFKTTDLLVDINQPNQ